ncbi:MAG: D-glycero-beta-D-manno-heptose 1-phosphate adenylyltransferase [Bacteroidia bacterium]|nr:D-glycero-beta-D-manno-heptose 1-phosphate adenylyltransferase [Bacteroidia bacterium]
MSFREHLNKKIIQADEAARLVRSYNIFGKKVVFTNGCFDILHKGHVFYLAEARGLGHCLMVGLNSDNSVRKLNKGSERPINKEEDRALLLASLSFVDYVILFEEDTPLELIRKIQPDILVKGGDYTPDKVVGKDIVEKKGGSVVIIPYIEGYSTTQTIDKLKK